MFVGSSSRAMQVAVDFDERAPLVDFCSVDRNGCPTLTRITSPVAERSMRISDTLVLPFTTRSVAVDDLWWRPLVALRLHLVGVPSFSSFTVEDEDEEEDEEEEEEEEGMGADEAVMVVYYTQRADGRA